MTFVANELKELVIIPTLQYLEMNSESAVNLLLGTAAQESQLGKYLKQIKGPALSIYQIEPRTHEDTWKNFINFRSELKDKMISLLCGNCIGNTVVKSDGTTRLSKHVNFSNEWFNLNLVGNLFYATAIARLIYYRVPESLPDFSDVVALARYYKKYYNTVGGKATESQFVYNYTKYVT